MRTPALFRFAVLLAAGLLLPAACDGDGGKRANGAVCGSSAQCESGICGGGLCLDPEGDDDTDGLINRIEAQLTTDPLAADTDGDGVGDADEVGSNPAVPVDTDGDGKIDAIESATADCDDDGIADQDDPDDGARADGSCGGGGTVKDDPCPELCEATARLGCPGVTEAACREQCSSLAGLYTNAGCEAEWIAIATCVASTEVECPAADAPADSSNMPEVPDGVCEAELTALQACAEDSVCDEPVVISVGDTVNGQVTDGVTSFSAPVTAGASYTVTLTPSSASDDPDLLVFGSRDAMCGYWDTVDAEAQGEDSDAARALRLGKSSNPPGAVDSVTVTAPEGADALFIMLSAPDGATASFSLQVTRDAVTPDGR